MRLLRRQPWRHQWRISIHVRTKYLDLRLRASRTFQYWNWKCSPLSLKIKLALKFCHNSFLSRSRPKKWCLSVLRELSFRSSPKKCLDLKSTSNAVIKIAKEERICAGLILIVLSSLMFESSSSSLRVRFMIVLFRFITYLYSSLIFKKHLPSRTWNVFAIFLTMAVFSWSIVVYLSNIKHHIWKLLHPFQMILMEFLENSLKESLGLLFNRFKGLSLLDYFGLNSD